jgi:hypothetical protein
MSELSEQNCTKPENEQALTGLAIGGLVLVVAVAAPFMLMLGVASALSLIDNSSDTVN